MASRPGKTSTRRRTGFGGGHSTSGCRCISTIISQICRNVGCEQNSCEKCGLFQLRSDWALARSGEPSGARSVSRITLRKTLSLLAKVGVSDQHASDTLEHHDCKQSLHDSRFLLPCRRRLCRLFRELLIIAHIYEGVANSKRKRKCFLRQDDEDTLLDTTSASSDASSSEGMEISRSLPLDSLSRPQGPRGPRDVKRVGRLGGSEYLDCSCQSLLTQPVTRKINLDS